MRERTNKRESVKSVDVDSRLADIFSSHRESRAEETVDSEVGVTHPISDSSDFNWLNQFIVEVPSDSINDTKESTNTPCFDVMRKEVRPFWNSPDDKLYISTWKKSRASLAKDCQKQRKVAIRKSIRK